MFEIDVRPLTEHDIPSIVEYWKTRTDENLLQMGADKEKLQQVDFQKLISDQLALPINEKKFFYVIWVLNGNPIGHSNVNNIQFGNHAYMHLHIWQADNRTRGIGTQLVKKSLAIYFKELQLQRVYCWPNAFNPAPNKTLRRVGFDLLEEHHICIPGFVNFEQPVNCYEMTAEKFSSL